MWKGVLPLGNTPLGDITDCEKLLHNEFADGVDILSGEADEVGALSQAVHVEAEALGVALLLHHHAAVEVDNLHGDVALNTFGADGDGVGGKYAT